MMLFFYLCKLRKQGDEICPFENELVSREIDYNNSEIDRKRMPLYDVNFLSFRKKKEKRRYDISF